MLASLKLIWKKNLSRLSLLIHTLIDILKYYLLPAPNIHFDNL